MSTTPTVYVCIRCAAGEHVVSQCNSWSRYTLCECSLANEPRPAMFISWNDLRLQAEKIVRGVRASDTKMCWHAVFGGCI
jgi:hypothetical protein